MMHWHFKGDIGFDEYSCFFKRSKQNLGTFDQGIFLGLQPILVILAFFDFPELAIYS